MPEKNKTKMDQLREFRERRYEKAMQQVKEAEPKIKKVKPKKKVRKK